MLAMQHYLLHERIHNLAVDVLGEPQPRRKQQRLVHRDAGTVDVVLQLAQ